MFRLRRLGSEVDFGTTNKVDLYKWLEALLPFVI